jgi:uncharacterized protein YfeS
LKSSKYLPDCKKNEKYHIGKFFLAGDISILNSEFQASSNRAKCLKKIRQALVKKDIKAKARNEILNLIRNSIPGLQYIF